jgi:tetratricopeptide (TPR) repeat protein
LSEAETRFADNPVCLLILVVRRYKWIRNPHFSSLMKRKVFIAITAAIISAFASVSSAQPKASFPTTQQLKPLPALSEEQVKSLIQAETEKKDALRGKAEAERKFDTTMVWVQVLLGGVSLLLAFVTIVPISLGFLFWIFRKSIFGQLNAEATKEVAKHVEEHIKPIIGTEVEAQVLALTERIKKLNQLVQELEVLVPKSTQVELSPEKLNQIHHLRLQIENLQDLIPFLSQPAEYYFKQGNTFYFEKQYKEAITFFNKAIELKPDYFDAWLNRGIALGDLDCDKEALVSYNRAIELNPNDSDAWFVRGIVLGRLGCHKKALVSYDKAIELNPNDSKIWLNRGNVLSNLDRDKEALVSYDKAIELKSDIHIVWDVRGNVLSNLSRYEEALVSYDKALEFTPNSSVTWYYKACCYALQEKVEETVHDLKKAIELDSKWREKAKTDSDFDKIRHDGRFQTLLNVEL